MTFTIRNHYVPQWYQRRFLPIGQSKLWYLDLRPDPIRRPDGTTTTRKALRHLGPVNCFLQDHLYTLCFGPYETDVLEKSFFGKVDTTGEKAVTFFSDYGMREGVHEAFNGMINYLSAQLFRTPKGLRMLQALAKSEDHQQTLKTLSIAGQVYHTIWIESVWAVKHCKDSPTKLIISDSPVTTYNRQVYPSSDEIRSFGMAHIERIGTQTLFPLDSDHCLIITNLQYVRNPKGNALNIRENPRYYAPAHFDLRKVQRGHALEEQEVVAINYILKTHANRYIASTNQEWLYPEKALTERKWPKLGGSRFALQADPRLVSFTTAIISGGDKGSWGYNEYGHFDLDGPRAKKLREVEWKTFQAAKQAWDERDRLAGREPSKEWLDYI
ncbi:MAG: DUF4238 domain-containing protein [Pseudomonadota bacterium]|nr:DUF4238 domain-containing protein [Pseudomonadota bacterium]